jgi:hypothetical protein
MDVGTLCYEQGVHSIFRRPLKIGRGVWVLAAGVSAIIGVSGTEAGGGRYLVHDEEGRGDSLDVGNDRLVGALPQVCLAGFSGLQSCSPLNLQHHMENLPPCLLNCINSLCAGLTFRQ